MNTDDILIESFEKVDQVFSNHETICLWDEIITGSYVLRDDGLKNKVKSVAPNTARTFNKVDKINNFKTLQILSDTNKILNNNHD